MSKFQNPCGYGIDTQTTREELIDYIGKLEDIRKRRNKQIKVLKKDIEDLEFLQREVDHFLIKKFGTSNLAELTR